MSNVLQKIVEYFQYDLGNFSAAFAALPFAALAAVIYWLIRRAVHKKKLGYRFKPARKNARWNEIIRLLLVFWIAEIACVTLFPIWFWGAVWDTLLYGNGHYWKLYIENTEFGHWKPVPMLWYMIFEPQFAGTDYKVGVVLEWAANVVLFVPMGLALPFVMKRPRLWKVVSTGFACTLFIETVQPFISREGTADDVINNTIGAVIGYLLYLAMKKVFPKFTQKCKVSAEG